MPELARQPEGGDTIISVLQRMVEARDITDDHVNLLLERVFGSVIAEKWEWLKKYLRLGTHADRRENDPDDHESNSDDGRAADQPYFDKVRNEGLVIIWNKLTHNHAWALALANATRPGVVNPEAAAAVYLKTCAKRALLAELRQTDILRAEIWKRVRSALTNGNFTGSGGSSAADRYYSPPGCNLERRSFTVEELCTGIHFAFPGSSSKDVGIPLPSSTQIAEHVRLIMETHDTSLRVPEIVDVIIAGFGLMNEENRPAMEASTPPSDVMTVQTFIDDLLSGLEELDGGPPAFPPDRSQQTAIFAEFLLWQTLPDATSPSGRYGIESYSRYAGIATSTVEERVKKKLLPLILSISRKHNLDEPGTAQIRSEAWERLRGIFLKFKPEFIIYTPFFMAKPT